MLIEHAEENNQGSFFMKMEDKIVALMTYTMSPGNLIIQHTEVDDSLRGKSVGMQLINHALALAREQKLKIIPVCPFVKAVFEKKPELYKDVWIKT